MIHYLFHYICFFIIYLIYKYDIKKHKHNYERTYNYVYWFLAFLVAVRYSIGVDTPKYMLAFYEIPKIQDLSWFDFVRFRFQPLYLITNSICRTIYNDFVSLQILQSLLFFYSYNLICKHLNIRKFYLLFFFYLVTYFTTCMSAMRECFALSFDLIALTFYFKRKWIYFYLFVFVAFMYHSGGIIFAVLPFFNIVLHTMKTKNILLFFSGLVISTFCFSHFQAMLDNVLSDGSIARYSITENGIFSNIFNVFKNFIQLYFIYKLIMRKKEFKENGHLIFLSLIYIFIDLISASILPIFYRFQSYFLIFYLLSIKLLYETRRLSLPTKIIITVFFFYQPISRYISLFKDETSSQRLEYYCSIFAQDKRYYDKIIRESDASDYILFSY